MSYFKRISVNDADRILRDEPNSILLDVRNERDYQDGHHPKALLLNDTLLHKILKTTDKSVPLIIYCYHGHSSQDFARLFADFGFKECYSVDGGYASWRHQVDETFPVSPQLDQWLDSKGVKDGDVNARIDRENTTPLMSAAKAGRHDIVLDLVLAGADPNLMDIKGNNALLYACLGQSIECVVELIKADVEVDNRNIYGFSALNYAVGMDHIFNTLANYFADDSLLRLNIVHQNSNHTRHAVSSQSFTHQ